MWQRVVGQKKKLIGYLIEQGGNINSFNNKLETPLDKATHKNRTSTADLLRKHGGKTTEELKAEGK